MMAFTHAWVLWGLPLALLPLWRGRRADATACPWLDLVPRDGWSTALDWARRLAAALAIAATLASLAGPYRAEERVERIGQGAEIVLVLDRSRSMDEEPVRGVNNLIGRAGAMTPNPSRRRRGGWSGCSSRGLHLQRAQRPVASQCEVSGRLGVIDSLRRSGVAGLRQRHLP